MPRKLREQAAGSIQHVTARSNHGMELFGNEAEYQRFLLLLWKIAAEQEWTCLTYCLMPNHVHLLIRNQADGLSRGMQQLTSGYARRYNRARERYGHVFQGRFHSRPIATGSHLLEVVRYIALNPVRAELCDRAVDYPWSAHRALLGIEPPRLVSVAETLALFGNSATRATYAAFVEEAHRPLPVAAIVPPAGPEAPTELAVLSRELDADALILAAHGRGHSFAAIARLLGRNRATVARRHAQLQEERVARGV